MAVTLRMRGCIDKDMDGLSGLVLPAHPQPKEDEIFSSWMCRIAQANGIKLHTLEVQLWGRDKQIWTRDIDRSVDDETLSTIAALCGTSFERAYETCLRELEGKLFEKLVMGNSPWILPAATYHRTRKRPFMQFCPTCLAKDKSPYYRRSWRLALTTFCDKHNVMLHDRCPKCEAPVMFYRQELGDRWITSIQSLTLCTSCGFDLRDAKVDEVMVVDRHALLTLRLQLRNLDLGWTFNDKQMFQYSQLYFSVLRNLIQKMMLPWTIRRLLTVAQVKFSLPSIKGSRARGLFEFYGVFERHLLLQVATWYLMDWPVRFQGLFRANRCRYSELVRDFKDVPYWFQSAASILEKLPLGASPEEMAAMRALLQKATDPKYRRRLQHLILRRLPGTAGFSSLDCFLRPFEWHSVIRPLRINRWRWPQFSPRS
ncbi:TniQ family protein [Massilia sp. NR 4-1]|uniref:TniQ family protein n=1 Tax=Massilia sp. NR 4-1 TaxID=1678028 RepID=UPI000ACCB6F5|nr:TniQ family protein [Massilia sp. NR 4-1]